MYQGNWYAGGHAPLVDLATFQRVQVLLGGQIYRSHESVYGCELVACGHGGHPVTGEVKTKQTKSGPKDYVYYRCSKYTAAGQRTFTLMPLATADGQLVRDTTGR
jgi:hypothetical protein